MMRVLAIVAIRLSIDEESVRASASAEAVPVGDIAIMLAEMKAAAAVQRLALETDPSPAFVLGCDQILACDEVIYSKPQDHAMAKAQLMALSGKTHQLFSAAVLYREGERIWHHLAIAKITMRRLDEDFIDPISIGLVQPLLARQQAIKSKILARIYYRGSMAVIFPFLGFRFSNCLAFCANMA